MFDELEDRKSYENHVIDLGKSMKINDSNERYALLENIVYSPIVLTEL